MPVPEHSKRLSEKFPGLKLLHVFPYFCSRGGVEAVLRLHHQYDSELGVESEFFIYSESGTQRDSRVHFHPIQPADSIAKASSSLRSITSGTASGSVVVYHMFWGIPFFATADRAEYRLLVQHGDLPDLDRHLSKVAKYLDGIFCVNTNLRERVASVLPHYDPSRLFTINCPIDPPLPRTKNHLSRPVRIGYCGRLLSHPKGVKRIPAFLAELRALHLDFKFEILGDGPDRESLQRQLSPADCRFHGMQTGADYWRILQSWDFIVFFSDSEGTPISLLEGMSQGVLPVYPQLGSGGDAYVTQLLPGLLYPAGNMAEAARALTAVTRLSHGDLSALSARSKELVRSHSVESYFPHFFEQVEAIRNRPRISTSRPPWPYRYLKNFPLRTFAALSALPARFRARLMKQP